MGILCAMTTSSCQRMLGGGGAAAARRAFLTKACAVAAAAWPGLVVSKDEAGFALTVEHASGRLTFPLAELYDECRELPKEAREPALREGLREALADVLP